MAYTIPPTSHELLQQILDEIKGLREDLHPVRSQSFPSENVNYTMNGITSSLTPEQVEELKQAVQAEMLKQMKRGRENQ